MDQYFETIKKMTNGNQVRKKLAASNEGENEKRIFFILINGEERFDVSFYRIKS